MTTVLYYHPGQEATVFLETLDSSGVRADGYDGYGLDGYAAAISRIISPDLSLASGFPAEMTKLDTGLYFFQFTLPRTSAAVGSYLIDVTYVKPNTDELLKKAYHLIVNAPYGNYSAGV